jgi:hypothetical protein
MVCYLLYQYDDVTTIQHKKIRKGLQFGQFALTPACATCDADPRTAIPNPPPMIAPNIAKYFHAILFSCFL